MNLKKAAIEPQTCIDSLNLNPGNGLTEGAAKWVQDTTQKCKAEHCFKKLNLDLSPVEQRQTHTQTKVVQHG